MLNSGELQCIQSINQMGKLSTFIVALLLLLPTRLLGEGGWQGYGNMSSSNLTVIFDYISANISTALSTPDVFCTQFSTYLNSKWDPAWNVFFINSAKDAVVYGYAFRNHWMWYNGYVANGQTVGFVLWKDYNCQGWKTIGVSTASGLDSDTRFTDALDAIINKGIDDIWGLAKAYVDSLLTQDGLGQNGYSIVASQQAVLPMYGYVCMVENNQFTWTMITSDSKGSLLVFQTR